jgi:dTDP-glucose 4,6-dehydratase
VGADVSMIAAQRLRLLVTGGAGFIGSHFVRHALRTRAGWDIVTLDKLTYAGNAANLTALEAEGLAARHRFVRGDIGDADLVTRLLGGGIDTVVNLAAESHVDRSILDSAPFLRTNVVGTEVLLAACRQVAVQRFVQVSTDEVYGPAPVGTAFTEEGHLRATSPYAASKAAADLLVLAFFRTYGVPAVIGRSTNNYGPFQHPEKFIPQVITNALESEPIPIYGDGQQVRDWIFVEDHCEALCRLVEGVPGEIYTRRRCESTSPPIVRPAGCSTVRPAVERDRRPAHHHRYALDDQKIRTALGYRPAWTLERGHATSWYSQRPDWWQPIKRGEYRAFHEAWYSNR